MNQSPVVEPVLAWVKCSKVASVNVTTEEEEGEEEETEKRGGSTQTPQRTPNHTRMTKEDGLHIR